MFNLLVRGIEAAPVDENETFKEKNIRRVRHVHDFLLQHRCQHAAVAVHTCFFA